LIIKNFEKYLDKFAQNDKQARFLCADRNLFPQFSSESPPPLTTFFFAGIEINFSSDLGQKRGSESAVNNFSLFSSGGLILFSLG